MSTTNYRFLEINSDRRSTGTPDDFTIQVPLEVFPSQLPPSGIKLYAYNCPIKFKKLLNAKTKFQITNGASGTCSGSINLYASPYYMVRNNDDLVLAFTREMTVPSDGGSNVSASYTLSYNATTRKYTFTKNNSSYLYIDFSVSNSVGPLMGFAESKIDMTSQSAVSSDFIAPSIDEILGITINATNNVFYLSPKRLLLPVYITTGTYASTAALATQIITDFNTQIARFFDTSPTFDVSSTVANTSMTLHISGTNHFYVWPYHTNANMLYYLNGTSTSYPIVPTENSGAQTVTIASLRSASYVIDNTNNVLYVIYRSYIARGDFTATSMTCTLSHGVYRNNVDLSLNMEASMNLISRGIPAFTNCTFHVDYYEDYNDDLNDELQEIRQSRYKMWTDPPQEFFIYFDNFADQSTYSTSYPISSEFRNIINANRYYEDNTIYITGTVSDLSETSTNFVHLKSDLVTSADTNMIVASGTSYVNTGIIATLEDTGVTEEVILPSDTPIINLQSSTIYNNLLRRVYSNSSNPLMIRFYLKPVILGLELDTTGFKYSIKFILIFER